MQAESKNRKNIKVSIYMAFSANGLISNQRGVPDWLSPEYGKGFMKICQRTKAVIMGKKSYDILAPDNLPLKEDGATIVLTSHIEAEPANPTVVFTSKSPKEILTLLEEKKHREAVIIGGTATVTEFLNSGMVDDIYFVVEPVLFGDGLPFFKNAGLELKLNLLDVKKMNKNTVQLHYEIQE